MEGFDKNYQPFMEAFGIPSFVVSFILGAEETFIVTIAENKKTVHFKTIMVSIICVILFKFCAIRNLMLLVLNTPDLHLYL